MLARQEKNKQSKQRFDGCKNKRELVLYGFIRQNANDFDVPPEIFSACMLFFDDRYHWKFQGDELQKIQNIFISHSKSKSNNKSNKNNSKHSDIFYSNPFYISSKHNIIIQSQLKIQYDCVELLLTVQSFSGNISTINVYYELYCQETSTEWKDTKTLTQKINHCHGWICDEQITISQYLQQKHSLDFSCFVDILHVIDEDDTDILNNKMEIDKNIIHDIIIRDPLLEKLKQCKRGQYLLIDTFHINRNWCLIFKENRFYLKLLKLPYYVESIEVEYVFRVKAPTYIKRKQVETFSYERNVSKPWFYAGFLSCLCEAIITITVNALMIKYR